MSKTWCRSGKEQKPQDLLYSLRTPHTEPPIYEKHSDKMAKIARDYHEALQETENVVDQTKRDEEMENVLKYIHTAIPADKKQKLGESLKEEEIAQAFKDIPEGKAPGVDGLPHELWKKLVEQHEDSKKNN